MLNKKKIKESICCFGSDVDYPEIFSDDIHNMTVGTLLNQIKGNDEDLYRKLVKYIRYVYYEGEISPEPAEPNNLTFDENPFGNIVNGPCRRNRGNNFHNDLFTREPFRVRGMHITKRMGEPIRIKKFDSLGENKKGPSRSELMIESYKILRNKTKNS